MWREIQGNYKKIDTIKYNKTDAAVISLVDFSLINYSDEYRKKINKHFNFKELEPFQSKKYSIPALGAIKIDTKKNDGENWLVFEFDVMGKDFVLEFDYRNTNVIHEFQLALNYRGIDERNRFLVIENNKLLFDCIKGGTFFPVLYDISISSIFKFDTINHVKLVSIKGIYSFYVNGLCLLAIKDKNRICRGKLLALILWEDSHNREIKCDIFNFSISILN